MRLGQGVLSDLHRALAIEWQLADGIGGSASGTAAGAAGRGAHGLLVTCSPEGRALTVLLEVDERLHLPSGPVDLATRVTAAGARPAGHALLDEFRLDPWPVWRWRIDSACLEKALLPIHGHHALAIIYRLLSGPEARLTLSPLVVARAPDALQREDAKLCGAVTGQAGRVRIELGAGLPTLTLWHNGDFLPARVWVRGLEYPHDRAAGGAAATEDALVPGYIETTLRPGASLHLVAAVEDGLFRALAVEGRLGAPPPRTLAECVAALDPIERARQESWDQEALAGADFTARQAAAAHGGPGEQAARESRPLIDREDGWTLPLARTLGNGLVRRGHRVTLVSRLPGGAEHPTETLRAVCGLIALRHFDAARAVLRGYLDALDDGLAPAGFDETDGYPRYGDPAPSLWLVHSGDLLARRADDAEFTRGALVPQLESVMHSFRAGTRHGVRVDRDGLLWAGEPDGRARCDLNALWYHALVAMAQLARLAGRKESGAFYLAWAHEQQKCFNQRFWDEGRGTLFDAITPAGMEPGLSPAQLLAVSLPPSPLPPERASALVATIQRELFTPLGLRPEPGSATCQPEWLGVFYAAYLRVHGRSIEAQARVQEWLTELHPAIERGAPLGTLTAAELLRTWIEEVEHVAQPAGVA
jgi:4-alpha-glucanotransferase